MNDTAVWLVIQAANMAEGGKRQPSSLCFCSAKKTVHVHCCCSSRSGKPVNYRTQMSHLEFERNLEASNAVSVARNLFKLWTCFLYSLLSNCGHFARSCFAPKRWFAWNKGLFQAHQTYNLPRLNFQRCICRSSHPLPIQCKASLKWQARQHVISRSKHPLSDFIVSCFPGALFKLCIVMIMFGFFFRGELSSM